jgi:hypothetical protein
MIQPCVTLHGAPAGSVLKSPYQGDKHVTEVAVDYWNFPPPHTSNVQLLHFYSPDSGAENIEATAAVLKSVAAAVAASQEFQVVAVKCAKQRQLCARVGAATNPLQVHTFSIHR